MSKRDRRRVAVAIAAGAVFALATSAGEGRKPVHCADARVDAAAWRTEHQRSLVSRSPTGAEQLALEFVRCRLLTGMGRGRVRRLLGRPDRAAAASWLYQLALDRGILSRPRYLGLVFGPGGVVVRAAVLPPGGR